MKRKYRRWSENEVQTLISMRRDGKVYKHIARVLDREADECRKKHDNLKRFTSRIIDETKENKLALKILLPASAYESVRAVSARLGITRAEFIRQAINKSLKEHK